MNATTIVIAVTVDGDHGGDNQHLGDRVAFLFDRHWDKEKLPRRVAQDIRAHRYGEGRIGDLLNKYSLGVETE